MAPPESVPPLTVPLEAGDVPAARVKVFPAVFCKVTLPVFVWIRPLFVSVGVLMVIAPPVAETHYRR